MNINSLPEPSDAMMPGVKCPGCAANDKETWVIPGKSCGVCGTEC